MTQTSRASYMELDITNRHKYKEQKGIKCWNTITDAQIKRRKHHSLDKFPFSSPSYPVLGQLDCLHQQNQTM